MDLYPIIPDGLGISAILSWTGNKKITDCLGFSPTCENQVAFKTHTLYLFLNWKQLTAVKAIEDAVQYIKM